MIRKIKINNCQSHKDTEINFTRGLNCILASSDVGKSALIRALRWVLFNDTYSKWTTWGQKHSSAQVDFDVSNETIKLIREKAKSINRYTIIKGKDETILNNFGDYPAIIGDSINFKKLEIDDKKSYNLNVLSQHDNLFLLNETNSIKARALSTLIGINKLDNIIKETNLKVKQTKSEKDRLLKEKELIQEKIKEFNDLKDLEIKLAKINELKQKLDTLNERKQGLNQLFINFNTFNTKYEEFIKKTLKLRNLDSLKVYKLEELINNLKILIRLNDSVQNLKDRINLFIESKKHIDLTKINLFNELKDKLSSYLELFNKDIKITNNILFIRQKKEDILKKQEDIGRNIKELLIEYKVCPICYKPLAEEDINEVLNHVL